MRETLDPQLRASIAAAAGVIGKSPPDLSEFDTVRVLGSETNAELKAMKDPKRLRMKIASLPGADASAKADVPLLGCGRGELQSV